MLVEWNLLSTGWFLSNGRDVFACNIWTNARKQMRIASEMLRFRAGTVHECFLRAEQRALSGTRLHRAGRGTTCRTCGQLDLRTSHDLFLSEYLKKGCTGTNLAPWKLCRVTSDWRLKNWQRHCTSHGGKHTTLCSEVPCWERWYFSTLYIKSSISPSIHICFFLVSYHSVHA